MARQNSVKQRANFALNLASHNNLKFLRCDKIAVSLRFLRLLLRLSIFY